ncbi:ABC transporter ATP-binding protein [hydrothermal vent metagenome]|uniref:ABC transporter ATP-binding protein n=1 Tax=hydrothermal vent metagenome TaxID=652676 RepID=A0A1W1EK35_9ZZZZ
MRIELKNIGMIKEASVKIDGLTVIAGENDTGKSTLGKSLYFLMTFLLDINKVINNNFTKNEEKRSLRLSKLIFDNQLSNKSSFALKTEVEFYQFGIEDNDISHENDFKIQIDKDDLKLPIMIETPLVWNLSKFFNQMANIQR